MFFYKQYPTYILYNIKTGLVTCKRRHLKQDQKLKMACLCKATYQSLLILKCAIVTPSRRQSGQQLTTGISCYGPDTANGLAKLRYTSNHSLLHWQYNAKNINSLLTRTTANGDVSHDAGKRSSNIYFKIQG